MYKLAIADYGMLAMIIVGLIIGIYFVYTEHFK